MNRFTIFARPLGELTCRAVLVGTLVTCIACQTPRENANESVPAYPTLDPTASGPEDQVREEIVTYKPAPWTTAFLEKAVLVADEILIEGPPGLVDHSATRTDAEFHTRTERTMVDGYLQEIRVSSANAPEIRCQLDALQIAAGKRLRILQRPGPTKITVRANGSAFWKEVATGKERRAETIELTGEVEE